MKYCNFSSIFLSILLANLQRVSGAVVTLYDVQLPNSGSGTLEIASTLSFSALGSVQSGKTLYGIEEILTQAVVKDVTTTRTILSTPTTYFYTLQEAATGLYFSRPFSPTSGALETQTAISPGLIRNCTFDTSSKTGTCEQKIVRPYLSGDTGNMKTMTGTETTTYSGALIPFATFTASAAPVGVRGLSDFLLVWAVVAAVLGSWVV